MSVTAPQGFVATGGPAGIKAGKVPDVAVVATAGGRAVPAAGVFTANLAAAAPVQVSRAHLAATAGAAAGVILTSGNANAATGAPGRAAAERLCVAVAGDIGASAEEILVCQTGLIGIPFPIDHVLPQLEPIVMARGATAHDAALAARAIMTTDTVPKEVVVPGDGFTVGGMAKGAAMLAPNMATMLALCTTDAAVDAATLHTALARAVAASFNTITVDGCTSTNDTVLVLASGLGASPTPATLTAALTEACRSLAEQMVDDAGRGDQGVARASPGRAERRGRAPRGAEGGGLHARHVLAERGGPVLGTRRLRARLRRHTVRHGPRVGGLRRHRGVCRRGGGAP